MIYAKDLTENGKKHVDMWLKRTVKKGPFYILDSYLQTDQSKFHGENTESYMKWDYKLNRDVEYTPTHKKQYKTYYLMWKEKDQIKIGFIEDRLYCRYGISTTAKVYYDSLNIIRIWGHLSPESEDYKIAKKWLDGSPPVDKEIFYVYNLKEINH